MAYGRKIGGRTTVFVNEKAYAVGLKNKISVLLSTITELTGEMAELKQRYNEHLSENNQLLVANRELQCKVDELEAVAAQFDSSIGEDVDKAVSELVTLKSEISDFPDRSSIIQHLQTEKDADYILRIPDISYTSDDALEKIIPKGYALKNIEQQENGYLTLVCTRKKNK